MDIDLKTLGLEKKWPKLTKLQTEVEGLQKRLGAAEGQVRLLQNQLGPARDKDLDAAAAAIRKGKEAPHGTHEDSAKRQLAAAERDRDVLAKAVESARQDLATFLQKHQPALYQDVLQARAEIAATVAQAAQEALAGFGRWSDMRYLLKDLAPPPDTSDYTGPSARSSTTVIGVATTQRGPDRGEVEAMLGYLVGLASGPAQGGKDAAA